LKNTIDDIVSTFFHKEFFPSATFSDNATVFTFGTALTTTFFEEQEQKTTTSAAISIVFDFLNYFYTRQKLKYPNNKKAIGIIIEALSFNT